MLGLTKCSPTSTMTSDFQQTVTVIEPESIEPSLLFRNTSNANARDSIERNIKTSNHQIGSDLFWKEGIVKNPCVPQIENMNPHGFPNSEETAKSSKMKVLTICSEQATRLIVHENPPAFEDGIKSNHTMDDFQMNDCNVTPSLAAEKIIVSRESSEILTKVNRDICIDESNNNRCIEIVPLQDDIQATNQTFHSSQVESTHAQSLHDLSNMASSDVTLDLRTCSEHDALQRHISRIDEVATDKVIEICPSSATGNRILSSDISTNCPTISPASYTVNNDNMFLTNQASTNSFSGKEQQSLGGYKTPHNYNAEFEKYVLANQPSVLPFSYDQSKYLEASNEVPSPHSQLKDKTFRVDTSSRPSSNEWPNSYGDRKLDKEIHNNSQLTLQIGIAPKLQEMVLRKMAANVCKSETEVVNCSSMDYDIQKILCEKTRDFTEALGLTKVPESNGCSNLTDLPHFNNTTGMMNKPSSYFPNEHTAQDIQQHIYRRGYHRRTGLKERRKAPKKKKPPLDILPLNELDELSKSYHFLKNSESIIPHAERRCNEEYNSTISTGQVQDQVNIGLSNFKPNMKEKETEQYTSTFGISSQIGQKQGDLNTSDDNTILHQSTPVSYPGKYSININNYDKCVMFNRSSPTLIAATKRSMMLRQSSPTLTSLINCPTRLPIASLEHLIDRSSHTTNMTVPNSIPVPKSVYSNGMHTQATSKECISSPSMLNAEGSDPDVNTNLTSPIIAQGFSSMKERVNCPVFPNTASTAHSHTDIPLMQGSVINPISSQRVCTPPNTSGVIPRLVEFLNHKRIAGLTKLESSKDLSNNVIDLTRDVGETNVKHGLCLPNIPTTSHSFGNCSTNKPVIISPSEQTFCTSRDSSVNLIADSSAATMSITPVPALIELEEGAQIPTLKKHALQPHELRTFAAMHAPTVVRLLTKKSLYSDKVKQKNGLKTPSTRIPRKKKNPKKTLLIVDGNNQPLKAHTVPKKETLRLTHAMTPPLAHTKPSSSDILIEPAPHDVQIGPTDYRSCEKLSRIKNKGESICRAHNLSIPKQSTNAIELSPTSSIPSYSLNDQSKTIQERSEINNCSSVSSCTSDIDLQNELPHLHNNPELPSTIHNHAYIPNQPVPKKLSLLSTKRMFMLCPHPTCTHGFSKGSHSSDLSKVIFKHICCKHMTGIAPPAHTPIITEEIPLDLTASVPSSPVFEPGLDLRYKPAISNQTAKATTITTEDTFYKLDIASTIPAIVIEPTEIFMRDNFLISEFESFHDKQITGQNNQNTQNNVDTSKSDGQLLGVHNETSVKNIHFMNNMQREDITKGQSHISEENEGIQRTKTISQNVEHTVYQTSETIVVEPVVGADIAQTGSVEVNKYSVMNSPKAHIDQTMQSKSQGLKKRKTSKAKGKFKKYIETSKTSQTLRDEKHPKKRKKVGKITIKCPNYFQVIGDIPLPPEQLVSNPAFVSNLSVQISPRKPKNSRKKQSQYTLIKSKKTVQRNLMKPKRVVKNKLIPENITKVSNEFTLSGRPRRATVNLSTYERMCSCTACSNFVLPKRRRSKENSSSGTPSSTPSTPTTPPMNTKKTSPLLLKRKGKTFTCISKCSNTRSEISDAAREDLPVSVSKSVTPFIQKPVNIDTEIPPKTMTTICNQYEQLQNNKTENDSIEQAIPMEVTIGSDPPMTSIIIDQPVEEVHLDSASNNIDPDLQKVQLSVESTKMEASFVTKIDSNSLSSLTLDYNITNPHITTTSDAKVTMVNKLGSTENTSPSGSDCDTVMKANLNSNRQAENNVSTSNSKDLHSSSTIADTLWSDLGTTETIREGSFQNPNENEVIAEVVTSEVSFNTATDAEGCQVIKPFTSDSDSDVEFPIFSAFSKQSDIDIAKTEGIQQTNTNLDSSQQKSRTRGLRRKRNSKRFVRRKKYSQGKQVNFSNKLLEEIEELPDIPPVCQTEMFNLKDSDYVMPSNELMLSYINTIKPCYVSLKRIHLPVKRKIIFPVEKSNSKKSISRFNTKILNQSNGENNHVIKTEPICHTGSDESTKDERIVNHCKWGPGNDSSTSAYSEEEITSENDMVDTKIFPTNEIVECLLKLSAGKAKKFISSEMPSEIGSDQAKSVPEWHPLSNILAGVSSTNKPMDSQEPLIVSFKGDAIKNSHDSVQKEYPTLDDINQSTKDKDDLRLKFEDEPCKTILDGKENEKLLNSVMTEKVKDAALLSSDIMLTLVDNKIDDLDYLEDPPIIKHSQDHEYRKCPNMPIPTLNCEITPQIDPESEDSRRVDGTSFDDIDRENLINSQDTQSKEEEGDSDTTIEMDIDNGEEKPDINQSIEKENISLSVLDLHKPEEYNKSPLNVFNTQSGTEIQTKLSEYRIVKEKKIKIGHIKSIHITKANKPEMNISEKQKQKELSTIPKEIESSVKIKVKNYNITKKCYVGLRRLKDVVNSKGEKRTFMDKASKVSTSADSKPSSTSNHSESILEMFQRELSEKRLLVSHIDNTSYTTSNELNEVRPGLSTQRGINDTKKELSLQDFVPNKYLS